MSSYTLPNLKNRSVYTGLTAHVVWILILALQYDDVEALTGIVACRTSSLT